MNASERTIATFLSSIGFTDLKYEPDGQVPPDFLVNGRIAVEVRRLNQNLEDSSGEPEGLEEVFDPFLNNLEQYLPTIAPGQAAGSWYVTAHVSRPLERWPVLRKKIREALVKITRDPVKNRLRQRITPTLN